MEIQQRLKVKIKKLDPSATIPQYATEGAACFDLHSIGPVGSARFNQPAVFRTGLQFEVPQGHVMLVFSRSGHGFKSGIRLANCVGVIDSDYRGEVMVKLTCDEVPGYQAPFDSWPSFVPGDRIAQAMILPVQQVTFEEVSELSETKRGQGGFGSTGHDMNREQILTKALEVTTQRQQVHGAPENTFGAIAALWSVYLSELFSQELELKDHQAATMMQLMKVARSIKSPENPDNYVDGAGYAACAGELAGQAALQQIVSMGQEIESQIKTHNESRHASWPVEEHGLPTNMVEQEKEFIAWDRLPANAKYVAKDHVGAYYWYSHKPVKVNTCQAWFVTDRDVMDRGAEVGCVVNKAEIPGDWKQSLRKRPK